MNVAVTSMEPTTALPLLLICRTLASGRIEPWRSRPRVTQRIQTTQLPGRPPLSGKAARAPCSRLARKR